MAQLADPGERAFLDKILQVARGGGARGPCDGDVVVGAQATLEAVDALTEHAGDDFPLRSTLKPSASSAAA